MERVIKSLNVHIDYLDIASIIARRSHCKRLQVGAVIVKDDIIIGHGYNGAPRGVCNDCEDKNNVTLPTIVHAELNAIINVARTNNSLIGSTLYVTHSPCISCASHIINAGISKVYFIKEYRSLDGVRFLSENGIMTLSLKE